MRLPVTARFDPRVERARTQIIEAADRLNHKKGQDVEIGEGRLILTDGTTGERFELFMDNGALLARPEGVVDGDITVVARLR